MTQTKRLECPNCNERIAVVNADGPGTTTFACPNCGEQVAVTFGAD